uniref:Uncharacterized protein n=1 Tax=Anguilla anguilla TaxID=7936 RepID=A0A0E9TWN1_ANGAN
MQIHEHRGRNGKSVRTSISVFYECSRLFYSATL